MKFKTLAALVFLPIISISSQTIQTKSYTPVIEKDYQLSRVTAKIIDCCFNKNNLLFFTNPNSTGGNILNLLSSSSTPLYLFDTRHESIFERRKRFQRVYLVNETHVSRRNLPLTGIAIVVASEGNLASILLRIKNSIWWNRGAQVLLINSAADGCQRAYYFLQTLWTYNILSTVYLCTNLSLGVSVYTFNPYSTNAPKFWNQVQTARSSSIGWTMFVFAGKQELLEMLLNSRRSNFSWSSMLFPDKLKNLENHNLNIVTNNDSKIYRYNEKKSGFDRCESAELKIMCMMLELIGATVTVKISSPASFFDNDGEPRGPMRDVMNGIVHILAIRFEFSGAWENQIYPFDSDPIRIITRKFTHESNAKFALFFNLDFWIYFIPCSIICVIATKYIFEVSLLDATFEFLRIFVSMPSFRQPQKLISFMIAFIIIFVTSSFFQGHLNASRTFPDPIAMIDSIEDLIKSNLSIHGFMGYKKKIPNGVLIERFHAYNNPRECVERLVSGEQIACLISSRIYPYFLSENKLIHISERYVIENYASYMFTVDSPLLHKFDDLLARFSEGGFMKLYFDREKLHYKKNFKETDLPKCINFDELKPFFVILVGGWVIAILSFFSEICVFQLR